MITVDYTNQGCDDPVHNPEDRRTIMTAYMDLLRPLPPLVERDLARFYAHFAYLWEEEFEVIQQDHDPWSDKNELKDRLEKYVMGERYESMYAGGQEEPVPCDWDHVYQTGPLW